MQCAGLWWAWIPPLSWLILFYDWQSVKPCAPVCSPPCHFVKHLFPLAKGLWCSRGFGAPLKWQVKLSACLNNFLAERYTARTRAVESEGQFRLWWQGATWILADGSRIALCAPVKWQPPWAYLASLVHCFTQLGALNGVLEERSECKVQKWVVKSPILWL